MEEAGLDAVEASVLPIPQADPCAPQSVPVDASFSTLLEDYIAVLSAPEFVLLPCGPGVLPLA